MAATWGDNPSEIAVLEQSPEAAYRDSESKLGESIELEKGANNLEKV